MKWILIPEDDRLPTAADVDWDSSIVVQDNYGCIRRVHWHTLNANPMRYRAWVEGYDKTMMPDPPSGVGAA